MKYGKWSDNEDTIIPALDSDMDCDILQKILSISVQLYFIYMFHGGVLTPTHVYIVVYMV